MRDAVLQKWREDPRLFEFSQYMSSQWLYGSFSTWQAYATPIGFASTNNPVETFNAVIKRDYTLRRRLKMGTLLREFSACCQDQSMSKRQFQFGVLAGASLTRRVADLARGNLLAISCCHPIDIESAGHSAIVRVKAVAPHRIVVAPNKRREEGIAVSTQMGVNYARMEIQNQPWGGGAGRSIYGGKLALATTGSCSDRACIYCTRMG
ncbi:hypothetical protein L914_18180 [Phytophthora nicotianae]|uniref:Uncharacterized protein n=1 Tax=Phytophthora nicotianae TaxID=4792 RepID=W2MEM2_PHYNI|nr:hypothetical protein L914_18180 [Phytophthora nicotianae]